MANRHQDLSRCSKVNCLDGNIWQPFDQFFGAQAAEPQPGQWTSFLAQIVRLVDQVDSLFFFGCQNAFKGSPYHLIW